MGQHWSSRIRSTMDAAYQGINGFHVRALKTKDTTVDTTYGELTFEGAQTLIDTLKLGRKDTLVDVGCGVGRLAFHVALASPAHVEGIEVVRERYDMAMSVWSHPAMAHVRDRVLLKYGDATMFNIRHATVLYMCSTCFPPGLTDAMVQQLKPGAAVVAATPLAHARLELVRTMSLPCTWNAQGVMFYFFVKT